MLRTRIALAVSAIFVLFVAILCYFTIAYFQNGFRQSLSVQQYSLVSSIAANVDSKLALAQKALESRAKTVTLHLINDAGEAQQFLNSRVSLLSIFDNGLFLIAADGTLVAESPFISMERRGRNLSFREYYRVTIETKRSHISEPYLSTHNPGHPAIFMTAPIFDQKGQVIGILGGSFDLLGDNMLGELATANIGKNGYLFLLHPDGTVIIHPDRNLIMKKYGAADSGPSARDNLPTFEGSKELKTPQGERVIASFRHIPSSGWVLLAHYPVKEAYAPLGQAKRYFLLALLIGSAAVLAMTWFLMRQMTTPLSLLTDQVEKLVNRDRNESWQPIKLYRNDELGKLAGAFNRMMTSLGHQQAALLESDTRFRLLFENAPLAYQSLDQQGRLLEVNHAWLQILGLNRQEVIGHWLGDFMSSYSAKSLPAIFEQFKATGEMDDPVFEMVKKNGSTFLASFNGKISYDEEGNFKQSHFIFIDITERRKAEEQIQKLNAELERRVAVRTAELQAVNSELEAFCYSISHDLRTPLRGICGFATILEQDFHDALGTEGGNYLKRICAATNRMSSLIDDLLVLARVSRCEIRHDLVNLSAMAEEIIKEIKERDAKRHVTFKVAPAMAAEGDPGMLRVVLENLIGNAWKFTARTNEARVEIGVDYLDGEEVFFVRDNGAGFKMEFCDKLFQPFQRLHGPEEFEGTGIGLASVARIINRHGGRTWAKGEPGKGATFWFTLARQGGLNESKAYLVGRG